MCRLQLLRALFSRIYVSFVFLDTIWVILQVSETGVLDITQGMSRFGVDLDNTGPKTADQIASSYNPFSSPHMNNRPSEGSTSNTSVLLHTSPVAATTTTTTSPMAAESCLSGATCTTTMSTATVNHSLNNSLLSNGTSRHIKFQSKVCTVCCCLLCIMQVVSLELTQADFNRSEKFRY